MWILRCNLLTASWPHECSCEKAAVTEEQTCASEAEVPRLVWHQEQAASIDQSQHGQMETGILGPWNGFSKYYGKCLSVCWDNDGAMALV
jgi:hypothetical protein